MRVDRAVGTGLHGIHPLEFRICSHGSTTACLCSERAGSNSFPVLKTRETQTGDPKMPGREGRAFYPLFPTSVHFTRSSLQASPSTSRCSQIFTPPGCMPLRPCSPTSCGMERIINSSYGYFSLYESSLNSIRERKYSFRQFIFLSIRRRSDNQG